MRDLLPIAVLVFYPVAAHVLIVTGFSPLALLALAATSLISLAAGWRLGRRGHPLWALACAGLGLAGLASFAHGTPLALFLPPVLINGMLAFVFGASLRPGERPLIERFMAALEFRGAEPPPALRAYARRLTLQWALFFAAVAAVSLLLAALAPLAAWSLFANVLVYPLGALLFLAQYGWRVWRYRRLGGRIALSRAWLLWREFSAGRPAGSGRD